jgi:hypothetical protein
MSSEIKALVGRNAQASQDCTGFMDQIAMLKEKDKERTGSSWIV